MNRFDLILTPGLTLYWSLWAKMYSFYLILTPCLTSYWSLRPNINNFDLIWPLIWPCIVFLDLKWIALNSFWPFIWPHIDPKFDILAFRSKFVTEMKLYLNNWIWIHLKLRFIVSDEMLLIHWNFILEQDVKFSTLTVVSQSLQRTTGQNSLLIPLSN